MRPFFLLVVATCTCNFVACWELSLNYSLVSVKAGGVCQATQDKVESIRQGIDSLINRSLLPALGACGGPEWRRAAYLNMSDPTQTCPPAWELIATPRRSCSRPSNAGRFSCYSAMFPTQGIQYSHVCGRIIGYQFGEPQAFIHSEGRTIDQRYVDGVSLTYGSPRQHIWTFANALDEAGGSGTCPCTTINQQSTINVPSFIGDDYFCETGVPPDQRYRSRTFYAADPLWDGGGCGPTSTCCTFNNPPWFYKQLPQSTNADLEARLCSYYFASAENTPIELIEVFVK